MDRRDRDEAVAHRVEVGAGAGVLLGAGRADPEPLPTARIDLRDAGLGAVPVALRLGLTKTIAAGTVLSLIGLAARPWVGAMWVFVVLTGLVVAGIAVANVLLPAWIKRHGGRHLLIGIERAAVTDTSWRTTCR